MDVTALAMEPCPAGFAQVDPKQQQHHALQNAGMEFLLEGKHVMTETQLILLAANQIVLEC